METIVAFCPPSDAGPETQASALAAVVPPVKFSTAILKQYCVPVPGPGAVMPVPVEFAATTDVTVGATGMVILCALPAPMSKTPMPFLKVLAEEMEAVLLVAEMFAVIPGIWGGVFGYAETAPVVRMSTPGFGPPKAISPPIVLGKVSLDRLPDTVGFGIVCARSVPGKSANNQMSFFIFISLMYHLTRTGLLMEGLNVTLVKQSMLSKNSECEGIYFKP